MHEEALDPHLRLFVGGGGNSTVLLHGTEALVVDVKMGDEARRLRHRIELDLAREVRRIVLTHAHFDHANGLELYPSAGAVLVHPNARARLEARGMHAPFVDVSDAVQLSLAGEQLEVRYLGVGHTDGDLVGFFPKRKLLIAGDLYVDGLEPIVDPSYGGDAMQLRRTLERVLELDFDEVVGGHGEPAKKEQVRAVVAYLKAMESEVSALVAQGRTEEQTVAEVKLAGFPELSSMPGRGRSANVRQMYQALKAGAKTAP